MLKKFLFIFLLASPLYLAGEVGAPGGAIPVPAQTGSAPILPYRTFITVQRFNIENSGDQKDPISNVRLSLVFPSGLTIYLPEGGQYWPIGNAQVQEINRTFEIPWAFIQNDGFKFVIKMEHKGNPLEPCNFDVVQLSQFNRAYTCHTDLTWQASKGIPQEKMNKEGVQIRVFTSKNSLPNEIPKDALALK